MGDNIQDTKASDEDLAVENAEKQLSDPSALNMQFLQSTLTNSVFDTTASATGLQDGVAKFSGSQFQASPAALSGLSPAYSGAGLFSAVSAASLGGASSAMGMTSQVASAAPVTFGKTTVGESANLNALGNKALAQPTDLSKLLDQGPLFKPVANADGSLVPLAPEFSQLLAMLEGGANGVNSNDALASLIKSMGDNPSAENLDAAIEAILGQINLLDSTFAPVFDGLSGEIVNQQAIQNGLPSVDLGLSIRDAAGEVSSSLGELLGPISGADNLLQSSLLNLGSAFDNISSLIGSLPDLDTTPVLDPVTDIIGGITDPITDIVDGIADPITDIVDGIIDPITDVVDGITDPITDIVDGITDPITDVVDGITDPITDIVDGITDPITDIVDGITDPITDVVDGITDPITDVVDGITDPITDVVDGITDPITDVVDGITDPITDVVDGITEPITDIIDGITGPLTDPLLGDGGLLSGLTNGSSGDPDSGLLGSLSSGISSSAGSDNGGGLGGLLSSLDPNR